MCCVNSTHGSLHFIKLQFRAFSSSPWAAVNAMKIPKTSLAKQHSPVQRWSPAEVNRLYTALRVLYGIEFKNSIQVQDRNTRKWAGTRASIDWHLVSSYLPGRSWTQCRSKFARLKCHTHLKEMQYPRSADELPSEKLASNLFYDESDFITQADKKERLMESTLSNTIIMPSTSLKKKESASWCDEEDQKLIEYAQSVLKLKAGCKNLGLPHWANFSAEIGFTKTPAQCMYRWEQYLYHKWKNSVEGRTDSFLTGRWSLQEDVSLLKGLAQLANEYEDPSRHPLYHPSFHRKLYFTLPWGAYSHVEKFMTLNRSQRQIHHRFSQFIDPRKILRYPTLWNPKNHEELHELTSNHGLDFEWLSLRMNAHLGYGHGRSVKHVPECTVYSPKLCQIHYYALWWCFGPEKFPIQ